MTRCVEGRKYRHDPQHDDPDLETDIGQCPECEGKGCDDDDLFDGDDDPDAGCPNKGGHEWIVEETEDGSEGPVYCEHCLVGGYL